MAWNQPTDVKVKDGVQSQHKKSAPSGLWIGILGIAIVIVGFGLYLVFAGTDDEKPAEQQKESRPVDNSVADTTLLQKQVETPTSIQKSAQEAEIRRRREALKKMTPEEKMDYLFELAKKQPLPEEPSSNRIFRTSLEQVMDWVFSCDVGSQPPLLPPMSMYDEAHLAEILISDNPIKDTDSERAKEAKETVKVAKAEFRKFINEGGDPFEFLPYYHGMLVKAHDEWKTARESIMETVRSEPEIALEFAEKVNADLEARGIKKVELPEKMLQKFGIIPQE